MCAHCAQMRSPFFHVDSGAGDSARFSRGPEVCYNAPMLRFCSVISGSNPRERIEALYECLAPLYSLLHPFVRTVAVRAANLLNDGTGQNALDVCTGTGVVADALVKRGYDVTGIDLASAMLMQRRQMRKTMGIKNARMDARRLAFPDRSFDVCAISMGLHEFSPADRGPNTRRDDSGQQAPHSGGGLFRNAALDSETGGMAGGEPFPGFHRWQPGRSTNRSGIEDYPAGSLVVNGTVPLRNPGGSAR